MTSAGCQYLSMIAGIDGVNVCESGAPSARRVRLRTRRTVGSDKTRLTVSGGPPLLIWKQHVALAAHLVPVLVAQRYAMTWPDRRGRGIPVYLK